MRESIHKYFQVGTIQWMSYPKSDPMDSLKAIAKDDYFDAIELKGYGEKNAEAKALLEQSHLKVCYGAQPRLLGPKLNPNAIDETERLKAEATLIEAVDEADNGRKTAKPDDGALSLDDCLNERLIDELRALDVNTLSPFECMSLLFEWKKQIR